MSRALSTALFATMLFPASVADAAAQSRLWQPDERIIISDGGLLGAVAVGIREVYAAAPANILVYDAPFRRWGTPMALPLEIADARVTALAWDVTLATLWLGTERGDVWSVTPGLNAWERVSAFTRGPVEVMVADRRQAAVWIRAGGEWLRASPGFRSADPVPTSAVPREVLQQATALPDDPYLRAERGTLGLDPNGRRWSVVDIERGTNPGEFWIATQGGGLLRFDSRFNSLREWLRYGLASRGAASIARIDDALWFGGDGRGERSGVARATEDLQTWMQFDGDAGAPRGFVAEIVRFGNAHWFASSDGLFRFEAARIDDVRTHRWTRQTTRDGLASDAVRSLIVARERLWAGTDRGLTSFDVQGRSVDGPLLAGRRVTRIVQLADTLYVASDDGLWCIALAQSPPTPGRCGSASARGRINDLALVNDEMFAIVGGAVYAVRTSSPPMRDPALSRIGEAYRLAAADGRLWAAGPGGIALRDPSTGAWTAFTVPGDVQAGPVVDVLPVGDDVWAATPAGAIRLRWR